MADAARLVDPIPGAVVAGAACRAAQRRNRVADARPRIRRYQGRGRGGRDAGRSAAGVDGLKMRATLSIETAAAALLLIDLQEEQRQVPHYAVAGYEVVLANAQRLLAAARVQGRSEEHTSELQSLMRISYAVF